MRGDKKIADLSNFIVERFFRENTGMGDLRMYPHQFKLSFLSVLSFLYLVSRITYSGRFGLILIPQEGKYRRSGPEISCSPSEMAKMDSYGRTPKGIKNGGGAAATVIGALQEAWLSEAPFIKTIVSLMLNQLEILWKRHNSLVAYCIFQIIIVIRVPVIVLRQGLRGFTIHALACLLILCCGTAQGQERRVSTETSLNIEDDDRGEHEVLGPQNGNVVISGGSSPSRNRSSTTLRITEGTTKSLTFELSSDPGRSVTLTIAEYSAFHADHSVPNPSANPTTLTFTPMNWNMAQTVEFEVEDNERELRKCRSQTYPDDWGNQGDFNISSDDPRYKPAAVTIFGYDDDNDECDSENYPHDASAGITAPSTKTVLEGNTTIVNVRLQAPPPNDVKVTFSDDGNSDLTWSGTTLSGDVLTFTSSNWDQAQTVTLTAAKDGDVADDTETLTLTASDGSYEQTSGKVTVTTPSDYPGKTAAITVTITDNDVRGITVPGTATVTEESTTTVGVKLAAEPTANMTVTLSDDGDSDVGWSGTTLSGNVLTFTASNWKEAQMVTLTAGQDDDLVNDTETLTLTASKSGGYNGETAEIAVTITDNDAAGITVPGTATVTEGNTTTVDVKLAAKPTGKVTVTLESHEKSDLFWTGSDLNGAVLTFTATNWNVAQTVTLVAQDDNDFEDDTEILTLRASKSGGYNEETAEITVTITDNDAAGITVPGTVTVTEGSTTTVDVKLAAPPVDDTKVTFSDDGDSDVSWSGTTLSGDALTFTDTNWNAAQTVTLTAAEDDDSKNDTETLTLTVSKNGETADITVTVTDDDAAAITVPSTKTVTEGSTTTVDVKLAAEPSGTVTVTFSHDGDSDVSWSGAKLSGDALTFTPNDWHVAQTVTLTAAEDDDFVNDTETLTLTASNGGYNGKTAELTVTVTDNDAAGITVPGTATVTEASTTTVDVKLAAEPSGPVTVTFSDDGNSDVTWSGTTLSGDALTFTTANWNVAQTVTLTAAADDDFVNDTETLTLTAANGGGYNGKTTNIKVTITDDDTAGITVPGKVTVTEGGTMTVDVKLAAAPTESMTVTLDDDGDSDVTWSGADFTEDALTLGAPTEDAPTLGALIFDVLTFTPTNWNEAQTVTLTAAEDDDFVNDTEILTLTASGGGHNGETAEITVRVTDDDEAGITASSTATMTEGSSTTVDVKLAAAPTGNMTITFSDDGDSDVSWSGTTLSGDALTFTNANWNVAQTVTLTAGQDDDFANDTETLTLTAANGSYNGETVKITVTITDDDEAGIVVQGTATITEGSSTTVDVKLAATPTGNMLVKFNDDGDSDVSWSGTTLLGGTALLFTTTNWNQTQTVTLTAEEDDDFVNDTEILTLTGSAGGYNGETANITVTIEDDGMGIVVPGTATVTEESTTTVDVKLSALPTGTVTVTFSNDGDSDVSWSGTALSGDALTFSMTNWSQAQTVTLTAAADNDFVNDTETLTLTASKSGGYNGETAEITVTITDNDTAGIAVPGTATVTEGNTTTVDVKLAVAPTANMTVTLSNDGNSDVSWSGTTLSGDALTFTDTNWSTAQTVTLTAEEDDDFVNDTEILTLTASKSGGYNGETAKITVTITDNDAAGITVPSTATVSEASTTTVDVKLAATPTGNVLVTLSDDGDSDVSWSGTTLSGNALTFTTANWNVAQTVTLTAAEDGDFANDTEILTLTASKSGGYNGEVANILVTVTDNDMAGITVPGTVAMTEGGTTTVDVKLAVAPTGNVTVTLSDDEDCDVRWSGAALTGDFLTFTPQNWNLAQTVTLTVAEDDDFVNDTETLTLTASKSGGYNGETAEITVTVTDDDTAGITVPGTATVTEGNTTTVDVKLAAAPTASMTVTLSHDGDSDMSWSGVALTGDVLTFIPQNWDLAQTVTLTAAADDDFVNDTEILTLTASGGGYNGETTEITVTIEDDDTAGITVPGTATVTEGGTTTVDVKLAAAPTVSMTVTLSNDGDSDVSWSGTTLSGDALTFTTTNWNKAQTVTLTAADDDDFVNDTEVLTLTASTSGGYNGETAEITVTIEDDDTAGITVPPVVSLIEGSTTTVEVNLAAVPTAEVTVTLSDDGDSDLTWSGTALSGDALTFTTTNWNVAQTVTLTAAQDDDFVNDTEILTLTTSKSGGYNGETANVAVTITDNNVSGIAALSEVSLTEGSSTTSEVRLATAPTANVTVTFSDDGDSDVSWSGTTLSGNALTFTTTNWNVAQTVTLTAAQDDDFVDDTEILTLTASTSGGYNGETAEITVTIDDNDVPGITVSGTATVTEGSTTTVEVKLAATPTGEVAVTLSDDGDSDVSWSGTTLSGDVLTFTTTNWNVAQAVTLTAEDDDDFEDGTVELNLTASGGGYDGVTADITVTIDDNDVDGGGITVPDTATMTEGSTTTVEVKLAAAPKGDVTVTLSDDEDSDVSWSGTAVSGDVLTFTTTNWNVAQTVTLMAAEDDDFVNDTEILTLTASTSGGYSGEMAEITVTITDNDAPGIAVSSTEVTVTEGGGFSVEVTLATAPKGNVVVTCSDDGDSDMHWSGTTLSGDALTFTTANWNVGQTVMLMAAEDDDFVNDTEILTLTASKSGGYNGETTEIMVTIDDNDVDGAGITVPSTLTVTEGSTMILDVKLAVAPTGDVAVIFSDDGASDLTWSGTALSGDTLTFDTTNWNVAQAVVLTAAETVTLKVAEDDDFWDNTEILMLTASGGGYDGVVAAITVTIMSNESLDISESELLQEVTLLGNYPNPLSDVANIEFDLPVPAQILVVITDMLGRTVKTLPYGWLEAGQAHTIKIDTARLTSGMYYYTLRVDMEGKVVQRSKSMTIVR